MWVTSEHFFLSPAKIYYRLVSQRDICILSLPLFLSSPVAPDTDGRSEWFNDTHFLPKKIIWTVLTFHGNCTHSQLTIIFDQLISMNVAQSVVSLFLTFSFSIPFGRPLPFLWHFFAGIDLRILVTVCIRYIPLDILWWKKWKKLVQTHTQKRTFGNARHCKGLKLAFRILICTFLLAVVVQLFLFPLSLSLSLCPQLMVSHIPIFIHATGFAFIFLAWVTLVNTLVWPFTRCTKKERKKERKRNSQKEKERGKWK